MARLQNVAAPPGPPSLAQPQADPATPASAASERKIEVLRREPIADLSTIPPQVQDGLSAMGYRATLASKHESVAVQLSANQRYPLCLTDLDPDMAEEFRRVLTRNGFRVQSDGFVTRGDCHLYIQPETARDEQLLKGLRLWMLQDDPRSVDASLTEFNDRFRAVLGQSSPRTRVTADPNYGGDVSRLSDHMITTWSEAQ